MRTFKKLLLLKIKNVGFTFRQSLSVSGTGTTIGSFFSGSDRWNGSGYFIANSSYILTKVGILITKSGSPSFNLRIHIYTNSGSGPGTDLGSSAWISTNTISSGTIYFTGLSVSVSSGTDYFVVIESDIIHGDGTNYINWLGDTNGSAPGGWYESTLGVSWSNVSSAYRVNYIIYSTP